MTGIIVIAAAEEELNAASSYYESLTRGAGDELITEVIEALALLAERPQLGTPIRHGARMFVLQRFPYKLIYKLHPEIVVLAIAHHRRKPGYWHKRIKDFK
ncbi:MAG TPA: type II toxin-antitoxin system RelE/ParE family toxin [Longimicrobium sp.]|nr:type II toxin-antitoxin system RelE/ParE family toxin [Longimicrobium sp.]